MKALRFNAALLFATALVLSASAATRAPEEATTLKFSDPAKPGTVKIQVARGDLRIQGTDTPDVTVKSEVPPATSKPRKDGLRVLTAASSYTLTEKDNVITLDALGEGWASSSSNFNLTVPRGTNVVVQSSFGGNIACAGITGDLEISSLNGEIRLDGVSGGVVVQTMNGEIQADIAKLQEGKPLSFTSMNGEVVLRLAPAAKASVRLRTQNGSVLTDFPESALVTKTEGSGGGGKFAHDGHRGVLPPEAREALREAGRVSAEAAREIAEAMREAAAAAREGLEATREGAEAARNAEDRPPKPPRPAFSPRVPKVPTIPTITGGKLVTGTLNGGGPEISVATMNGDVTLRQAEAK